MNQEVCLIFFMLYMGVKQLQGSFNSDISKDFKYIF